MMKKELRIDGQVVGRIRNGDKEAFRYLVGSIQQTAYYHALALTRDHDQASDLTQQCFIRTWRYRKSIDPGRPFYPWFYTMMKRLSYNSHRDRKRRKSVNFSDLGGRNGDSDDRSKTSGSGTGYWLEPVSDGDPSSDMVRKEENRMLTAALNRLCDDDREVIVLKDLEGYKYREISDLLGIPDGTVMSRLYSARQRLKTRLKEVGYEYNE